MSEPHSPAKPASVAVIVVNYNTAALTLQAVDSVLARDHGGRDVHVHLVDNASPAGDAAQFAERAQSAHWAGRVSFYPERENHGFGRGNNCALRALEPDPPEFVFFLNPDAHLENEAIDILARVLEDTPQAGLVGAGISKPDGNPTVAAFRFPNVMWEFGASVAFGPISRRFRRWEVALPADLPTQRVDWVSGAAFMMRYDVLKALNFFDPAYFLYYEEVDLMLQANRAGWEAWYVREARVVHEEGAATDVKSEQPIRKRKPDYWYQSWRYYFVKNHGRAMALVAACAWLLGAALNHVISRLLGRRPYAALNFFGDFWRVALRPLLGLSERPRQ